MTFKIVSKKIIAGAGRRNSHQEQSWFDPFCTGLSPQRRASPSPPPKVASKVVPWYLKSQSRNSGPGGGCQTLFDIFDVLFTTVFAGFPF